MTRTVRRPTPATLRVSVTDAKGRPIAVGPAAGLGRWLITAAPRAARGAVSIAIVSDRTMQTLNQAHRRVDHATDVLSFPAQSESGPRPAFLGDIAIARGIAAQQAKRAGHSARTELRILALHGLLHLLGYDHEADSGEMARTEDRLRRRAGLPAGLIARATPPPGRRH